MTYHGYICVPRELRTHWIWQQDKKLKMWLDLVMLAAWEDIDVAIGNNIMTIHRGQYITSIRAISRIWGCCNQTASDFLKLLEQCKMIKREITPKMSILTIVDYDKYQPWSVQSLGQFSIQEEEKKNNIENKNITSSTSRKQDLIFIDNIFSDEKFFIESANDLNLTVEDCKTRFLKLKEKWLKKKHYHINEQDYREHLINSIQYSLTYQKESNDGKQSKAETKNKYETRRGTPAVNHQADDYGGAF